MIIHVFADPSHAWGKVKRSMLERLGVDREISPYSYQRGEFAYLEEDRDLGQRFTRPRHGDVQTGE